MQLCKHVPFSVAEASNDKSCWGITTNVLLEEQNSCVIGCDSFVQPLGPQMCIEHCTCTETLLPCAIRVLLRMIPQAKASIPVCRAVVVPPCTTLSHRCPARVPPVSRPRVPPVSRWCHVAKFYQVRARARARGGDCLVQHTPNVWTSVVPPVSRRCPAVSRRVPPVSRRCPAVSRRCPAGVPPCPALRQEATLQAMSLNTEIILFMQAGTGSCLPKLVETSAAWHRQLQNNTVDAPLRLRMASNFWSALSARVEMVQANLQTELAQGLRDKGLLNADGAWVFLAWDASSKSLKPTTQTPIPMSEMVQIIASIVELVKLPAMVNQFKALKALKSADLKSPTVVIPWTMAVSLRHERAQQLWQHLMRLVGSSVTQLLMCQMRPANLKRSKLSELIAKCVFGPK